jgi:hypothetical protein
VILRKSVSVHVEGADELKKFVSGGRGGHRRRSIRPHESQRLGAAAEVRHGIARIRQQPRPTTLPEADSPAADFHLLRCDPRFVRILYLQHKPEWFLTFLQRPQDFIPQPGADPAAAPVAGDSEVFDEDTLD